MVNWSLKQRDPQAIRALMPILGWFYHHYFQVQSDGWEHMPPKGKVLIVASHNGGLAMPDAFMLMYDWFQHFGIDRPAYGLLYAKAWDTPFSHYAAKFGALVAHPQAAIAALQKEAAVLVYPGAVEDLFRPYSQRHQICLNNQKGFIKLALREEAPLVPVVSTGAHETLIILENFRPQFQHLYQQLQTLGLPGIKQMPDTFPIYLGLPWGLGIGPLPNFPLPVPIRLRICSPVIFERYGPEAVKDQSYVDACYEQVRDHMQAELDRLVQIS